MKSSIYKNPSYCLSFDNDTVFLDLEVEIVEESVDQKVYKLLIKKAQLDITQEAFPAWLLSLTSGSVLEKVQQEVDRRLTEELTPSLYSLFYAGDLQS